MQEIGSEFPGDVMPSVTTMKVLFPRESTAVSTVGTPVENEVPLFMAIRPVGAPATHVIVVGGGALLRTETESDFPAWIEGQMGFLCWRFGEDKIGYWHPTTAGFDGRRALPSDQLSAPELN